MPSRPTPNRRTPRCDGTALVPSPGELASAIPLASPGWSAWLHDPAHTTFAYAGQGGAFTARCDRRGDRAYWYAYRRQGGCVRKAYLGKVEQVTATRLAVVAATLCQSTAAPARAVMRPTRLPGNLPTSLTSFVEREHELVEVARRLNAARLLTLTGAGGVGKSRLALAVAQAVRTEYRDGAWLVELAPLAEPALVPAAVAGALGVAEPPGQPLADALANWLAPRQALLLLDNCEHLIDACARLADSLLHACPGLVILATSREPLHVAGEVRWRVPSLAVPDRSAMSPEDVGQVAAARLFVERARAVQPHYTLMAANAPAVAELCRRLDGIPLAIELAAARVAAVSVDQIVARLDDQLRLLTGGDRIGSLRQQTLRATIDWSYDLLSEAERALLRRLSIFAGGWTLEAAEEVCAGDGVEAHEVLDLLARLIEQSLVQVEAGQAGETRYQLLEMVRQYALERLREAGDEPAARGRLVRWCLALAERLEPALLAGDQLGAMARLAAEQDNVRAALAWSLDGDAAIGLRVAAAIWRYWRYRGQLAEGRQWLEGLLARTATDTARAAACLGVGYLTWDAGDLTAARGAGEDSRRLYRAGGDRYGESYALCLLGMVCFHLGDLPSSCRQLEEAVTLARAAGDHHRLEVSHYLLGHALTLVGAYPRARQLLEESVAALGAGGDGYNHLGALMCLGTLLSEAGAFAAARAALEESCVIGRRVGLGYGSLFAAARLGQLAYREGDDELAERLLVEALATSPAHGFLLVAPGILAWLGRVQWRRGNAGRARETLRAGLRQSLIHDRRMMADALEGLALVASGQGQAAGAARLLGTAAAVRAAQHQPRPPVEQPDHDATVRAGRTALGEAAWTAAWDEGWARSPDRVVDEMTEPGVAWSSLVGPSGATPLAQKATLSAREGEVAALVARGLTNRQVAAELSISPRTVDRHIENILNKLDLNVRAQVAAWVVARRGRAGLLPDA